MPINQSLLEVYTAEARLTRKILEQVPFENPEWQPHEMSMTMQRLASHIAEIPLWTHYIINQDEFDFAKTVIERFWAKDRTELLQRFQEKSDETVSLLQSVTDDVLLANWTMRRGDTIATVAPRTTAFRNMVIHHTIHHRGQLSVYLRLNNVFVPGLYGPSADERKAMQ